jgi:hypothetical protein
MDQHSSNARRPSGQGLENSRWGLIPALTFAGLLSAIFSTWIRYPAIATAHNETIFIFVVLASLSFGLALAAVLWFYGLIPSWNALAAVVAVTVADHLLELYLEPHLPIPLREYVGISALVVAPRVALTSFAVAFVLFLVLLIATIPKSKIGWAIVIAGVFASLAGVTIAVVDGTQRGAWFSFWGGNALDLLWQLALAFFLAIALTFKGATPFFRVPVSDKKPRASFKMRIAVFGILLVFWSITAAWAHSFGVREAKRIRELQTRVKTEISKSIAEAPSIENFPGLAQQPLDQIHLLQEINGWKPYLSGSNDYPTQKNGGDMSAPSPERRTYYARYATDGNNGAVAANVTEYPNAAWAKYAVRNTPMAHEFINHPNSIKHLVRFGNNLFQDGPYVFWPSDRYLVLLEYQGANFPEVVDQFLKVYLAKYQSSL